MLGIHEGNGEATGTLVLRLPDTKFLTERMLLAHTINSNTSAPFTAVLTTAGDVSGGASRTAVSVRRSEMLKNHCTAANGRDRSVAMTSVACNTS